MKLDDTTNQILSSLTQWKLSLIAALPNLVTALIVLILGWGLAWALRRVVRGIFRRLAMQIPSGAGRAAWSEAVEDNDVGNIAAGGVYWLVLLITAMVAVDALDIAVFSRWVGAFASSPAEIGDGRRALVCGHRGGSARPKRDREDGHPIASFTNPRLGSVRAAGDRDCHSPSRSRAAWIGCVASELDLHDFGSGHTRGRSAGVWPRRPRAGGGHSCDALHEQVSPNRTAGSAWPRRRPHREDGSGRRSSWRLPMARSRFQVVISGTVAACS